MSTPDPPVGTPAVLTATWGQYTGLLDAERLEYTDGQVVCRPRPNPRQLVVRVALFQLLTAAAGSDRTVLVATPWVLEPGVVRAPDLLLVPGAAAHAWPLLTVPLLVVEIVETGQERALLARGSDYHRGGAEGLRILDVRVAMLECYERTSSSWSTLAVLNQQNGSAQVPLPGGGDVQLSLPTLLP